MQMKLGIYKHYKGTLYRVTAIARHSETLEEYVVYTQVDNTQNTWVRPLSLFLESVNSQPRFRFVSSENG
ncbi:MAG: DUF1653 domain-containing protein [Chlamydiae bacterium CG10_big_fil_rev_8_21_14_0_10_42_34]|nr:MAG: DUF1653 domain-containing protein [Chlamydiae bacterium CG10_big_fil_rev_8_21_14_0_10_42_34]